MLLILCFFFIKIFNCNSSSVSLDYLKKDLINLNHSLTQNLTLKQKPHQMNDAEYYDLVVKYVNIVVSPILLALGKLFFFF